MRQEATRERGARLIMCWFCKIHFVLCGLLGQGTKMQLKIREMMHGSSICSRWCLPSQSPAAIPIIQLRFQPESPAAREQVVPTGMEMQHIFAPASPTTDTTPLSNLQCTHWTSCRSRWPVSWPLVPLFPRQRTSKIYVPAGLTFFTSGFWSRRDQNGRENSAIGRTQERQRCR